MLQKSWTWLTEFNDSWDTTNEKWCVLFLSHFYSLCSFLKNSLPFLYWIFDILCPFFLCLFNCFIFWATAVWVYGLLLSLLSGITTSWDRGVFEVLGIESHARQELSVLYYLSGLFCLLNSYLNISPVHGVFHIFFPLY